MEGVNRSGEILQIDIPNWCRSDHLGRHAAAADHFLILQEQCLTACTILYLWIYDMIWTTDDRQMSSNEDGCLDPIFQIKNPFKILRS